MKIQPALIGLPTSGAKHTAQPVSQTQHSQPLFGRKHADSVKFGGGNPALLAKYNVDADKFRVEAPAGITLDDKGAILTKLIETHEQAVKNKLLGNLSGRFYATSTQLSDGTWGTATNIENSRDVGIVCGERSSLVRSWNNFIEKTPLSVLQDPAQAKELANNLKVKMLVMSSGTAFDDPSAGSPCTECQSWMATDRYYTPDTLIVSLRKQAETGELFLKARKLGDIQPFWGKSQPSLTDQPMKQLPVKVSDKAAAAMATKGITQNQLVTLMSKAQQRYNANALAELSDKNTASSVLFSNGKIVSGSRFDWTMRWFETPDLTTAASGYRKFAEKGAPAQIQALAYYGNDKNIPPIPTMGVLAQPSRGGLDTILLVIENNTLQVRTIQDYMTDVYVGSLKKIAPPAK
jgi:cytidine deaminase